MRFNETRYEYTLSTGRRVYANNGILGIGPDGGIYEGYDSCVLDDDFTDDERAEIADYMIELWQAYKVKK